MEISIDQWLNEMARVMRRSDDGMTVQELCIAMGRGGNWIRGQLLAGMKSGRVGRGARNIVRLDGRACSVPVYYVVKSKK